MFWNLHAQISLYVLQPSETHVSRILKANMEKEVSELTGHENRVGTAPSKTKKSNLRIISLRRNIIFQNLLFEIPTVSFGLYPRNWSSSQLATLPPPPDVVEVMNTLDFRLEFNGSKSWFPKRSPLWSNFQQTTTVKLSQATNDPSSWRSDVWRILFEIWRKGWWLLHTLSFHDELTVGLVQKNPQLPKTLPPFGFSEASTRGEDLCFLSWQNRQHIVEPHVMWTHITRFKLLCKFGNACLKAIGSNLGPHLTNLNNWIVSNLILAWVYSPWMFRNILLLSSASPFEGDLRFGGSISPSTSCWSPVGYRGSARIPQWELIHLFLVSCIGKKCRVILL